MKHTILALICMLISNISQASTPERFLKKNYEKYYSLEGYNGEGKAKVYSQHFHNKKTASGMKFSHYLHTAASVKLPLMSIIKVTNKRNGRSVDVLINDRGPYKTNAIIDLSKATAKALNYHSSDQVVVEFDMEKTLKLVSNAYELTEFTNNL